MSPRPGCGTVEVVPVLPCLECADGRNRIRYIRTYHRPAYAAAYRAAVVLSDYCGWARQTGAACRGPF